MTPVAIIVIVIVVVVIVGTAVEGEAGIEPKAAVAVMVAPTAVTEIAGEVTVAKTTVPHTAHMTHVTRGCWQ